MSQSEVREAGLREFQQGDFAGAIPHLQAAIQETPEDATLWVYLGLAYSAEGKRGPAIQHLRQAAALAPDSSAIHYNLGLVLEQSGDFSGSRESLERALAVDPSHPKARSALDRLPTASTVSAEPELISAPPAGPSVSAPHAPEPVANADSAPPPVGATATPVAESVVGPDPRSGDSEPPHGLPIAPVLQLATPMAVPPAGSAQRERAPDSAVRVAARRSRLPIIIGGAAVGLVLLLLIGFWFFDQVSSFMAERSSPADSSAGTKPPMRDVQGRLIDDVGHTDLASLTPLPSGPGIQVGEPVSQGADAATQALGDGCSRWLQFTLAGQGELGKTPLWTSAYFASLEVKKTRPRITRADAPVFAANLGVTHVAVSEVGGTRGHCLLRYRLLGFPGGREVGAPVTLSGTEAQVVAGLPGVAREFCTRMGLRAPLIPTKTSESPGILRDIGSLPWRPKPGISDSEQSALERVQHVSPIGTLLEILLLADVADGGFLCVEEGGALTFAPEHPLLLAETALVSREGGARHLPIQHPGQMAGALRRFPNNYLLQAAKTWRLQGEGRFGPARQAAETGLRCSPGSPSAWLLLSGTYTQAGNRIRNGAVITALTRQQLTACEEIYTQELAVLRRAAETAPRNSFIAVQLSQAAASAGEGELADEAFSRALQRLPVDPDVYVWGLQLYHPKWYQNDAKAAQVAQAAARAAAAYGAQWSPNERVEVAMYAALLGHPEAARRIVRTDDERRNLAKAVRLNAEQLVKRPGG